MNEKKKGNKLRRGRGVSLADEYRDRQIVREKGDLRKKRNGERRF